MKNRLFKFRPLLPTIAEESDLFYREAYEKLEKLEASIATIKGLWDKPICCYDTENKQQLLFLQTILINNKNTFQLTNEALQYYLDILTRAGSIGEMVQEISEQCLKECADLSQEQLSELGINVTNTYWTLQNFKAQYKALSADIAQHEQKKPHGQNLASFLGNALNASYERKKMLLEVVKKEIAQYQKSWNKELLLLKHREVTNIENDFKETLTLFYQDNELRSKVRRLLKGWGRECVLLRKNTASYEQSLPEMENNRMTHRQ